MVESSELTKLVDLIAEFERLDDLLLRTIRHGGPKAIQSMIVTLEAKKKVKRCLAKCGPLNVGQDLRIKLKKIRDNYGYNIDRVLESLERNIGAKISQESEGNIDYVDALFSEGTADYVDENFFRRKNQIGTLLVSESLPDHLIQHFSNLRECYALGLFQAVVVYCRAVIETGCFEALRRRKQMKHTTKVMDIREFSLKALMRSVKPFVYKANWDKADVTIKIANEILHSKRKKVVVSEEEAFDAIQNTFALVEELFSGGGWKAGGG